MQLNPPSTGSIRARLGAAACVLLATGVPAAAAADSGATNQLDFSMLLYGEQARAKVVEPTARVTRISPSGQIISGQIGLDVITGASPSGALPSGVIPPPTQGGGEDVHAVHTVTAASGGGGGGGEVDPGAIPTAPFNDARVALDGNWLRPFGMITPALGAHFSRERDYQSLGLNGKMSLELLRKLTTVTVGAGYNQDYVFPTGGTRLALSDSVIIVGTDWNPKDVNSGMLGVSQILSRRWMVALNGSRSVERGYLTEPYKVVSLMDPLSGLTVGQVTEKRPDRRDRRDVLASTVYHFARDVLYLSDRYYWDDWGVRSNTIDVKYRRELEHNEYVMPHVRYYSQSQADFFRFGLVQGDPLPNFVSSDQRLGPLQSVTLGATLGFAVQNTPGQWSIRGEYIRQFGDGHPSYVTGVQQTFDLFPPVNIGSLVVAYSVGF